MGGGVFPLLFTEVGYTDDVNSPYDQATNAGHPKPAPAGTVTPGLTQQANIYQAFFNVNARHGDLIAGTFLWGNDYFPYNGSGCGVVDWGLRCNGPAREVVTSHYAQWKHADAERVFAWAHSVYPAIFSGASTSGDFAGYYYRRYAGTGTYLGLQDSSDDIFVHDGAQFRFFNAGAMRTYLDLAARAGF